MDDSTIQLAQLLAKFGPLGIYAVLALMWRKLSRIEKIEARLGRLEHKLGTEPPFELTDRKP